MDKIIIAMTDETYARSLYRSLAEIFSGKYNLEIGQAKGEKGLYLVDTPNNSLERAIVFTDQVDSKGIYKYQSINEIVRLIENKLGATKVLGASKLIALVNLDFTIGSLESKYELAKKFNELGPTLMVNFAEYAKYGTESDDLGLEDMILAEKMKSKLKLDDLVNKGDYFDYINSCIDPFELRKLSKDEIGKLSVKLKSSFYNTILLEMNFSFDFLSFELIRLADLVVLYQRDFSSNAYISKLIKDLLKKRILSDDYLLVNLQDGEINDRIISFASKG